MNVIALLVALFLLSCTHGPNKKHANDPVSVSQRNEQSQTKELKPAPVPEIPVSESSTQKCKPLPSGIDRAPFVFANYPVLATRFLKYCRTSSGLAGVEADSPWTGMGVPCSGGGGKAEWRGNFHNPKMISFSLDTDCPMKPSNADEFLMIARQQVHLDAGAKLVSYVPMAVQFWEWDEYSESDTGALIELREGPNVEKAWTRFRNMQSFAIRFYGRENIWGASDQLYRVEAMLVPMSKSQFRLDVQKIMVLSDDDSKLLKTKCESLKPKRDCNTLFD